MFPFSAFRRPYKFIERRYAGHPLHVFKAVLKSFFVAHVVWDYFYAYSPTRGPSMLPTLEVLGDAVVVDRHYRRGRDIQVGDLVTFDSVVEPGEKVLKRVLGLPGDFVLRDTPESGSDTMIQIPQGHCWLVGDNLAASRDSRMFGPVPMALIKGKIVYKLFPFSERRVLDNSLQHVPLD